ncbi:hypothetical protein BJ166DRAFT_568238, partial [Pestalotiopsis sp. NC0098]
IRLQHLPNDDIFTPGILSALNIPSRTHSFFFPHSFFFSPLNCCFPFILFFNPQLTFPRRCVIVARPSLQLLFWVSSYCDTLTFTYCCCSSFITAC